jgi:hypothetical protein
LGAIETNILAAEVLKSGELPHAAAQKGHDAAARKLRSHRPEMTLSHAIVVAGAVTAFLWSEAAARHLSLTKAALELNVTPGALSHQIRGLEDLLGLKLFDRGVRSIALTAAGKALQPGLQTGFLHIRDALASLSRLSDARVLVISTPPGFTSKWLAPRLYRFSIAHPKPTCAFPRRSTTPISPPTASTARSKTFRSIRRTMKRLRSKS